MIQQEYATIRHFKDTEFPNAQIFGNMLMLKSYLIFDENLLAVYAFPHCFKLNILIFSLSSRTPVVFIP